MGCTSMSASAVDATGKIEESDDPFLEESEELEPLMIKKRSTIGGQAGKQVIFSYRNLKRDDLRPGV